MSMIPKHRNKYFTNDGGLFCWWCFLPCVLYFWSWVSFLSVTAEGEVSSSRRMKHYLLSPSLVSQGWKESCPNVRYKKSLLLSSLIQWERVQANYLVNKTSKMLQVIFEPCITIHSIVSSEFISKIVCRLRVGFHCRVIFLVNALEIYVREWSRGNVWKATLKREVERGWNFTLTRDLPYSLFYIRA